MLIYTFTGGLRCAATSGYFLAPFRGAPPHRRTDVPTYRRTDKMKLLLIAGARPNFMKIAPLIRAIERHNVRCAGSTHLKSEICDLKSPISYSLVHTGQHYDEKMSDVFFRELAMPAPDVNLEVGSGSHAVQTANIMARFEPVCLEQKPDWVVVVGDVNSTMACTLVASKLGTKVAHVEAGLRSFDRTMPEEINRIVTDALADLLLTPSEDANENLLREGIPAEKIRLVGNIMIDALVEHLPQARQSNILKSLDLEPGQFAYVTLHRPSNVDDRSSLTAIMEELRHLGEKMPVVFPIHPRTRKKLSEFGISWNGVSALKAIEPIGYCDSLCLTENARLVLTDSGGLQEETTFFHTPCLTLRPNTERPVTVTMGSNQLADKKSLQIHLQQLLDGEPRFGRTPPLWEGRAAERIVLELAGKSVCPD